MPLSLTPSWGGYVPTPERSTNPVWRSQARQKQYLYSVAYHSSDGALGAAESGLCLLTQAAIEKQPFVHTAGWGDL